MWGPSTACPALPWLPAPRAQPALALAPAGGALLCGGRDFDGVHQDCLQLGAGAANWTYHSRLVVARAGAAMVRAGGTLYLVGGAGAGQVSEHLGPGDRWAVGPAVLPGGAGEVAGHCLLPYRGDSFLLLGGLTDGVASARVHLYNTTTAGWAEWPGMGRARSQHACAWVEGGILVAGGLGGAAVSTEFLHLESMEWGEAGALVEAREAGRLAVLPDITGHSAFMLGGHSRAEGHSLASVEVQVEGGWEKVEVGMVERRAEHAAAHVPYSFCSGGRLL